MKTVCVVIVTYRKVGTFSRLLSDIKKQASNLSGYDLRILIMHMGNTVDWINHAVSTARVASFTQIHKMKQNLGFAVGCNAALEILSAEAYERVWFLNPDTMVRDGCLKSLIASSSDIVGPVISYTREQQRYYDLGGYVRMWIGRPWHREITAEIPSHIEDPVYVSGCAMMVKKDVIDIIGGFDERYFLYFEDIDFCLRAKEKGYTVSVSSRAVIDHDLEEGRRRSYKKHLYLLASNLVFIRTWVVWWKRPFAFLYWIVLLLRVVYFSFRFAYGNK